MKKIIILIFSFLFLVPFVYSQEICEAPVWKVGDEWEYTHREREKRVFVTHKVVDVTENFYILAIGGVEGLFVYDKKTMHVKFFIDKDGNQQDFIHPMRKFFDFPMFVGKSWSDEFVKRGKESKLEFKTSIYFNVEAIENIQVPVSYFKTFRIYSKEDIAIDSVKSSAWVHYWYSPEAKNVVKRRIGQKSPLGFEISLYRYSLKN